MTTRMDLLVCADCGSAYYDAPPSKDEFRMRCICPVCRPDRPDMTIRIERKVVAVPRSGLAAIGRVRSGEVFGCPEAAKALTATWEV